MLIAQRRWNVELLSGTTVHIHTESYDYPRGSGNAFGMSLVGGDTQNAVWMQYFKNIRDYYVNCYGATVTYDVKGNHQSVPGASPWKPADPYPGFDGP